MRMNDDELEALNQVIIDIYNQIELELIAEIASRFDTYDTIGGSLEWQLKKLQEMGVLNKKMISIIAANSKKSEVEIKKMLQSSMFANISDSDSVEVTFENLMKKEIYKDIYDSSYKELDSCLKLIQTNALESAKQSYMDIINQSYLEVSSGIYSYQESISKGIKKMADEGIYAATYKRQDGTIVHYSIEAAVRRDTLTAVHKSCNAAAYQNAVEMNFPCVDISSHMGARVSDDNPIANHAGWQGKRYSILHRSDKFPDLIEKTGYGDLLGLAGVNCKHRMYPAQEDDQFTAEEINEEENAKRNALTEKQRSMERNIRKLKKECAAFKACGDDEQYKKTKAKLKQKQAEMNDFCEKNDLKRQFSREEVQNE